MALGAVGSMVGCARAGQAAIGAMLEVESGYGKYVGLSAMPSSQVIYGIVIMLTLKRTLMPDNAGGVCAVGLLAGIALLVCSVYEGYCIASSINVSKSKPEVFGLSIAPAAVVEGFAVFTLVFALVLAGMLPK
jgi:V/A-type H+-transporting ATPase subunit K